jgi:hypothetical protein
VFAVFSACFAPTHGGREPAERHGSTELTKVTPPTCAAALAG